MRTYYIYKATNKVNGLSYIGRTCQMSERKWQHERCYPKEDCEFHRAIQEYGKENFDWEILDTADSEELGNELEKKYIAEYNTIVPNGYNMTKGGFNNPIHRSKPVVCLELDGTFVNRYESACDAERDGYFCVIMCCNNPNRTTMGKQFMFESDYIANGARVYEKPESTSMVPVVQCDLNGNEIARYKSVTDASEKTGIRRSTISGVITGTYKQAGGFIWVYEKDFPIKDIKKYVHRKKGIKVAQIDPETGEVIEVFDRIADAGRKLGVSYKAIHKVVDKKGRTAYGYKWISR